MVNVQIQYRSIMALPTLGGFAVLCLFASLAACSPQPREHTQNDPQTLETKGYSLTPVVSMVSEVDGEWVVTGQAAPEGRVRLVASNNNAAGFTADSKGRFQATLPVRGRGEVYRLYTEDRGRSVPSDGQLFIPAGYPQRSTLLRPGAPGIALLDSSALAVVDNTGGGMLAVSGRVAPSTSVMISVNGRTVRAVQSDSNGRYSAVLETALSGEITLEARSPSGAQRRTVTLTGDSLSSDPQGARITPLLEGWRVDWDMPGGGVQTTYVFR